MAITTQDIHQAADKIAAEGGNPTLAAVRKALGGGSFTTISEAMQVWKSKHTQAEALIREAAPAAVSEKMDEIWSIALQMASTRLKAEREALELARSEMEETKQEAINLADQLNSELEQAQAAIEQQGLSLAKAVAELEAERIAREKAAAALTETHELIKTLNSKLEDAQTKASESAQAASLLQGKVEVLEKQVATQDALYELISNEIKGGVNHE